MKRFISLLIITALMAPTLAGCNGGDDVSNYDGPVFYSEQRFHSFAITPDAEVYGLTFGQEVGKYTSDGELLDTYPGTEEFSKLCYSNGFLYAYDQTARAFVELDTATKNIRVINSDSDVLWWVRSMAVLDGSLYAVAVENFAGDMKLNPDGYIDYGEIFFEVDIESGQMTERSEVKKSIAIYPASNGTLYIYSHPEDEYILYAFNTKSKKLKKESGMNDAGYAAAFVREGNFFVYAGDRGLNAKNMKDKKVSACVYWAMLPPGYDMAFHKGNIVFADMSPKDGDNALRNVLLGKKSVVPLDGRGRIADLKGEITVTGHIGSLRWDTDALLQITGVSAILEPMYPFTPDPAIAAERHQEFLTSMMAGNPDIDIYIMAGEIDAVRTVREIGYYVPLNGSAPIQGYFDRCFDWVGESAKAPNGDTWALPVDYLMCALLYVPENMERFGIAPEDLAAFDCYWDTLNRINPVKGEEYITYFDGLGYHFMMQYDSLCRDAGVYEYATPLYRNLFEKMYSGWYIFIGDDDDRLRKHPVIQHDYDIYLNGMKDETGRRNYWNPERVIFAAGGINSIFSSMGNYNENVLAFMYDEVLGTIFTDVEFELNDLRRWRALPLPRISEDVTRNYTGALYAFVNPYGKNKELAVEYLEAVAENMLAVSCNIEYSAAPFDKTPQFTIKDPSAYEGYYDMSIPIFMDIYEIFKDGAQGEIAMSAENSDFDYHMPYVVNYQDGKITLDEAIAARQREVDMWLYE